MTPAEKSTSIPTIFDLLPMTLILDEGHMLRNRGKQYYGMLALRDRALAIIVATATPLHTAPKVTLLTFTHFNLYTFLIIVVLIGSCVRGSYAEHSPIYLTGLSRGRD